jgi:hypothetical protein
MQIQTDSCCGLISKDRLSDLATLRVTKVILLKIRRKRPTKA